MEARTEELAARDTGLPVGKLIPNIPFEVYANADGINSSGLKEVLRSPAHFYESRYNRVEKKETDALVFGKLFHYAVLEPTVFLERHAIEPKFDKRYKTARQEWEAWKAALKPDAIIVPEKHVEKLVRMSEKILRHPKAKNILSQGFRETTLFWDCPRTGVRCKARPDFISGYGHMVDLKTSTDARYERFQRDIWTLLYHLQCAHYLEGARVTKVCNPEVFIFMVIEKDPPYEIAIYPAGPSVLNIGEQWRERAMLIYSRCLKANTWPGYNADARTIEMPIWAEAVDPFEGEPEDLSWLPQ